MKLPLRVDSVDKLNAVCEVGGLRLNEPPTRLIQASAPPSNVPREASCLIQRGLQGQPASVNRLLA